MLIQDIITISVLIAIIFTVIFLHVLSRTKIVYKIEQKRNAKIEEEISWNKVSSLIYYNETTLYKIYNISPPKKKINSIFKIKKYIKKTLTENLKQLNSTHSLQTVTDAYLQANNIIHSNIVNPTLTFEAILLFLNNDYDLKKIAKLQAAGLDYENILETYQMPLEWVESLYKIDFNENYPAQPIIRF